MGDIALPEIGPSAMYILPPGAILMEDPHQYQWRGQVYGVGVPGSPQLPMIVHQENEATGTSREIRYSDGTLRSVDGYILQDPGDHFAAKDNPSFPESVMRLSDGNALPANDPFVAFRIGTGWPAGVARMVWDALQSVGISPFASISDAGGITRVVTTKKGTWVPINPETPDPRFDIGQPEGYIPPGGDNPDFEADAPPALIPPEAEWPGNHPGDMPAAGGGAGGEDRTKEVEVGDVADLDHRTTTLEPWQQGGPAVTFSPGVMLAALALVTVVPLLVTSLTMPGRRR